ncbi:MAG: ribosome silencing factor [Chlamydiae bacterium CG10_big_fil_rev_8_21_14_0_10_35_9]|nr:MAG: ribosome silencing factor [Chlamydiae bacterium CG10_big_fil_rev_8_21_14_0_10_35_9]
MKNDLISILSNIAQIIYDKKGFNILALDLRECSSITDYVLIAEGNVDRHVKALANELLDELGEKPYRIEGLEDSDWIVIDYLDVIVHLFVPSMRERYQIEHLWPDAKIVELGIEVNQ